MFPQMFDKAVLELIGTRTIDVFDLIGELKELGAFSSSIDLKQHVFNVLGFLYSNKKVIRVGTTSYSRGGLNSANSFVCHMYAEIVSRLRQAGFDVVPSMDNYF